jgi:hypothetical protein
MSSRQKPSETTETYWIHAKPIRSELIRPAYIGKWLVYAPSSDIDRVWELIRKANDKGFLGIGAKVATAKSNPNSSDPDTKVICVYTGDYENIEDVRLVGLELNKLGFGLDRPIYYKPDTMTYEGKYAKTGSRFNSIYSMHNGVLSRHVDVGVWKEI